MSSKSINPLKLGISEKLRDPARRKRTFLRMAQDEIAMQIRTLRAERGYPTQGSFARHAHMQQSAISRIENADYMGWSFRTLLRVADSLDARLRVTFERAEDVIKKFEAAEEDERLDFQTFDDTRIDTMDATFDGGFRVRKESDSDDGLNIHSDRSEATFSLIGLQ
jgi:transcriptional regulator with XRE-family HTH domain